MKQRGMTLIEIMVLIVIAITVILIGAGFLTQNQMGPQAYSYGANGLIEVRCMNNLKFVVGENGHVTQMLDSEGHGVKCDDLVHRF
jgi:competence protein ComGC